jgi:hypothetical protein
LASSLAAVGLGADPGQLGTESARGSCGRSTRRMITIKAEQEHYCLVTEPVARRLFFGGCGHGMA